MMGNQNKGDGQHDRRGEWIAWVILAIIFIFGIVMVMAVLRNDKRDNNGLAEMVAAKSIASCDNYNNGGGNIYEALNHQSTDGAINGVKSEVGALSLYMSKMISDNEKDNLKEFGEIKAQNAALTALVSQLANKSNNEDIALKTASLVMGFPYAKCG